MPNAVLDIFLEGGEKKYYPGELVVGTVRVKVIKKIKVKAFTLHVQGSSVVHMQNVKNPKKDLTDQALKSFVFYEDHYDLLSKENSSNLSVLSEGEHQFSFSFQIPEDVQSSFRSENGYVLHTCQAELIPSSFSSRLTKELFIEVVSKVDLNLHKELWTPVEKFKDTKTMRSLLGKGGTVSAQLRLLRSGFVPGDDIVVNAEVTNTAKCSLTATKLNLVQIVNYQVDAHTLTVHRDVDSITKKCLDSESLKWTDECLTVPDLPPSTNLQQVPNLIEIQYAVKFQVLPKFSSFKLEVTIPVTIGSVSLQTQTEKDKLNATYFRRDSCKRPAPMPPTAPPIGSNEAPVGATAVLPQPTVPPTAPPLAPSADPHVISLTDPPPKYEDIVFDDPN